MPPRKFLIDTDAGIDDAQAILMALAYPQEVEIVAITTTHGNIGCDQVALNVLRLLQMAGRMDIPVYKGVKKPMLGKLTHAKNYHGEDGFGDVPDPNSPGHEYIQTEHATSTIVRLAEQYKGELEMICLGPLTNIAFALRLDPELGDKVKQCYIMGGNYEGRGNVTPAAEFNFYCDPEAANVVLNELSCKITMVCWELCLKYALEWDWYYNNFISVPSKKAKFIKHIEEQTIQKYYTAQKFKTYITADQLIMAFAIQQDIAVKSDYLLTSVEMHGTHTRGQLVLDWMNHEKKQENVEFLKEIDFDLYKKMLIYSVQPL